MAWVVERGLLRRLYDRDPLTQLLCTFALVLIIGDVAKMIWGTEQYRVPYPAGFDRAVDLGLVFYPRYLLFLCVAGPLVALGLWFLLACTRWGRIVRAATQDREMLAALDFALELSDRVYIVEKGTVCYSGSADELRADEGAQRRFLTV